jgi:hypothetical protein
MSFGEYFNAFGSIGDAYREAFDRADQKKYAQDAADLSSKQLDAYLAQQGVQPQIGLGMLSQGSRAPAPGGLSALGAPTATPRLPSFADASSPGGDYLSKLALRESGGNPNARAGTSSATGLHQFTGGTWQEMMRKHPELGLTPNGRTDPDQSTKAAHAFTADNEAILSRAGLPVTDATRYSLHFLGSGGGPKFVAGAIQNPDAPAVAFVQPAQANANRTIFYNRDGTPKSAGTVLGSFAKSFGGGQTQTAQASVAVPTFGGGQVADTGGQPPAMQMPGVIANAPLPPQRPVQLASADPDSLQLPAGASGPNPGAPQPAPRQVIPAPPMQAPAAQRPMSMPGQPSQQALPLSFPQQQAAADDQANMPVPNAQPAGFQMPPAPQAQAQGDFVPGTVAAPAIQAGRAQDLPAVAGAPRMSPQQAQFLRAQLANPLTRPQAIQAIQGLGAPEKWETKELGGRVVQVNSRGEVRALPGFDKPEELTQFKASDGNDYLLNKRTGQTTRLIQGKDEGYTTLITAEQRAQYGVDPAYKGVVQVGPNQQLAFPGKASTEVNVNQTAEKAQDSKIGGAYGDTFNELQSSGRNAIGQLNTYRLMEKLIDNPNFYSGAQSGPLLAARRAAAALGIKDADAAAPNELFAKLATQSVLDKLGGSLGAGVSNSDVLTMQNTVANGTNTPEGNRQILQFSKALAQRQIEVSKLARQYAGAHGGRLDPGFDDKLAEYAEANPLTVPPTEMQQRQAAQAAQAAQQGGPRTGGGLPTLGGRPAQAQDAASPSPYREGQTATNPQTGAKAVFQGGRWVPVQQGPAPSQAGGIL